MGRMGMEVETIDEPVGDCVDCGKPFWLAIGEQRFFQRQNIPLPKRCADCRERKRLANERR